MHTLTDHLFREHSGKMIAVLVGRYGAVHIDVIMDAVQEAFEAALRKWRFTGIPHNPAAWLMTVARNGAVNRLNRDRRYCAVPECMEDTAGPAGEWMLGRRHVEDSQLRLLLACCQPELSPRSQIIITLSVLSGFGTSEIGSALLMSREAVKRSITRAKAVLRSAAGLFRVPLRSALNTHMRTVHTVLYLLFNEGYKTTRAKTGVSKELCYEAIRLTQLVAREDPQQEQTTALLALQFFNVSRFPARITESGEWLTLEEQDRSLWDAACIQQGFYYLQQLQQLKTLNRYYLEALIASIHCAAPSFAHTNWVRIAGLYKRLEQLVPDSEIIVLNRIIAESHAGAEGRSLLDHLMRMGSLVKKGKGFEWALAKAHLYQQIDENTLAMAALNEALQYAGTLAGRQFVIRKMEKLPQS